MNSVATVTQSRAQAAVPLSAAALAEGISLRHMRRQIAAGVYRAATTGTSERNGLATRLILIDSLSHEARARLAAQLPAAPPPQLLPDLVAVEAAGREPAAREYSRRLAAIGDVQRRLESCGHGDKEKVWHEVAVELGVTTRTLRRWARTARDQGPVALVPLHGRDRRRPRRLLAPLREAIKASYLLRQRQTLSQLMTHTVAPWCEDHDVPIPHRTTVARFIEQTVGKSEEVAFRMGKKEWMAKVRVNICRNPMALAPNEIWCADNRLLDVNVIGPDGQVMRPWVCAIVDIRSAAWVAWRMLPGSPTARNVGLALRDAILAWGCPAWFYCDNGRDFQAKLLQGTESPDRCPAVLPGDAIRLGLLQTLEIQTITALPFHAWSKPIESLFNAFSKQHENLIPGWCGRDSKDKPEQLKAQIARGQLLTWPQALELWSGLVRKWNETHVCGDRKLPPVEHYRDAAVRAVPREALDALLMPIESRVVRQNGIEVCGKHFLEHLELLVGDRVAVRYDPDDLSSIVVHVIGSGKRIVVPQLPSAGWHDGGGEVQRLAQRLRSNQRKELQGIAGDLAAASNPAYQDPTGAYRMVAERLAGEKRNQSATIAALAAEQKEIAGERRAAADSARADDSAARAALRRVGSDWAAKQDTYKAMESA